MKNAHKLQEKILLARAKNNDPDAFAEIFNFYADRIYRYVLFKVSSHLDAEDITSEVFLKTWKYILENEREISNLNALLYQIARNLAVDFYRKRAQGEVLLESEVINLIPDHKQQNLLLHMEIASDMERVRQVLMTLKDEYKDVILLRYVEELSIYEISRIMNKSRGAVRVLIHRALKILKQKLTEI